ncbi:MAG: hypothetical protein HY350_03145 [Candidatus Omnitrophica bacterium]|nr:hypothetical protein [Candidatus Omnitrophota bacterium]
MVYLFFKSSVSFFASLIAGVLIDIDHVLDYYIANGITLKIKNIYQWFKGLNFTHVFIPLHSIELVFILWIVISLFKLGIFWVALAIGFTQHMILDILSNNKIIYAYGYFLSFRTIKKFCRENLCKIF